MRIAYSKKGIQHIGLPTADIDKTIDFYEDLGFTVLYNTVNPENDTRVAFLSLKNLMIETYESKEAAGIPGSIDHIALDVEDIQGTFELIKSENFDLLDTEVHYLPFFKNGVKYFIIVGPNGEKIEFNQML